MKTILVVDDEAKIVKVVRDYLERAGFRVLAAGDGRTALWMARTEKPDLVILDLGLPQMDGLDVTRQLRQVSNVPLIMLTARTEESDKITGLELGADDYITKPFSPKEVVTRVRVVLRRAEGAAAVPEILHAADLTLDMGRMQVSAEGRQVGELTPTEFALLAAMARQPGRVFTRSQLLEAVHGMAFESYERAIDAHIKNIRRKIELDPSQPCLLLTVYGVGYRLSEA
jgi:two-component system alkaline phosphatase synthesis response regulator PhoP